MLKKAFSTKTSYFFPLKFAKFEPDISIKRSSTCSKSPVIKNTLLQRLMFKQQQSNTTDSYTDKYFYGFEATLNRHIASSPLMTNCINFYTE